METQKSIRVKSAEQLNIGDEVLLNLNGAYCDVVIDGVTLITPEVELTHHTRGLPDSWRGRTRLPRYHSVRLIDGE